ncbi:Uncharacterised protein [Klebsiella oxytoca]|nr:Uncharacterised protein [Klebsiella oxytoca]
MQELFCGIRGKNVFCPRADYAGGIVIQNGLVLSDNIRQRYNTMNHKPDISNSEAACLVTPSRSERHRSSRSDLRSGMADGTLPVPIPVTDQDSLLPGIEARLAEEVRCLASALERFSISTQRISEELPDSSQFGKLITGFFSISSFQLANALLKDRDKPLLLDDGTQHLSELGLSLNDFIREIDLEGRKFLAVALINKRFTNSTNGSETGE